MEFNYTGAFDQFPMKCNRFVFFFLFSVVFTHIQAFQKENTLLIVSNIPETLLGPGRILEREIDAETLRLVYYHQNAASHNLTFHAFIRNDGITTANLSFIRSEGGPSRDGIFVGHKTTRTFLSLLSQNQYKNLTIGPGVGKSILFQNVTPLSIVSGILQILNPDRMPLHLKLHIIDPEYRHLSSLNETEAPYKGAVFTESFRKKTILLDCNQPLYEIRIGDKPFLRDNVTGIELKGNYGLLYSIQIQLVNASPTFRQVTLYYAPRGGIGRGTMLIEDKMMETSLFRLEDYLSPEKVYSLTLNPGQNKHVSLLTMPQAGSFYPVSLIIQSEPVLRIAELSDEY